VYGGGGAARIETARSPAGRPGVRITFSDNGPGIPDLDLALTDGWSSGSGLGLGLSGARRLVDEFDLATEVGAGTSVTVAKWSR
jgi:serine/threonine-protein kinase RsbT